MLAFFPILETLLKCASPRLLFRFSFNLLHRSKTLSFQRCLRFWEEEKVSGGQIRCIRWFRHDYVFFCQKLPHKHRWKSWCVIIVQNPWLVFPQFCAFLTNCFAQSAHNFKLVFLFDPTILVARIHDTPSHCNWRKQWKNFTFNWTWGAFVGLGSSGRFHWHDWALVSMS